MLDDTKIGGPSHKFPTTRRSAIAASRSSHREERQQALDTIVAVYWKPVYTYIRLKWRQPNEDAKDLTQAFFARALEKEFFKNFSPRRASFRTFIRVCVDRFVINESKFAHRLKRGGAASFVELENVEEPESTSLDELFEKEWVRSIFNTSVEDFRELCTRRRKPIHFQIFERYVLEENDVSYSQLAAEYGMPATDVTNYLSWCRKEFRRLVLHRLQEVTADSAEFRSEARVLGRSFGDLR